MKDSVSIRLGTEEIIALERCLADRDAQEAFRVLKILSDKVRYEQASS